MANYKDAGVDVEAGYEAVRLIRKQVARTFRPGVIGDIGGFGGLFSLGKYKYEEPVLISGTDGVGTKLKLAFIMDRHDTIGIDCVAMCVNDIICSGAEPLFFLDYIATGRNDPEKISQIVKGVADGCVMSGCALIGGETAEMPGFYQENEYDIAGFAVGIAEKSEIIDGSSIGQGDILIGIASSGVHSNGFSLVRRILSPSREKLEERIEKIGISLGDELLKPTKIYVQLVMKLIRKFKIKGLSHITGGGFIENIPRMLPPGVKAVVRKGTWPVLPIFDLIRKLGNIPEKDMYNTFNMGIGMVAAVGADDAEAVMELIKNEGMNAYIIGEVSANEVSAGAVSAQDVLARDVPSLADKAGKAAGAAAESSAGSEGSGIFAGAGIDIC